MICDSKGVLIIRNNEKSLNKNWSFQRITVVMAIVAKPQKCVLANKAVLKKAIAVLIMI